MLRSPFGELDCGAECIPCTYNPVRRFFFAPRVFFVARVFCSACFFSCLKCHSSNRHSRTCGAKKKMPPGAFFLLGMRHSGTRGAKKKTRPCDFLVRTDAPKTPLGTYVQNFEDTPGAGIMTPQKQREGRHLRPEFRRRSTRQRHDSPKTTRGSPFTQNFADAPHASVPTGRKQRKGHHVRPEFRGRSRRQHHDAAKTTRGSPLTPGISQTLHASASRGAKNNERVGTYALNFEDAPRASVTTRQKQREGRHLRPEFGRRSTRQRSDAPQSSPPFANKKSAPYHKISWLVIRLRDLQVFSNRTTRKHQSFTHTKRHAT